MPLVDEEDACSVVELGKKDAYRVLQQRSATKSLGLNREGNGFANKMLILVISLAGCKLLSHPIKSSRTKGMSKLPAVSDRGQEFFCKELEGFLSVHSACMLPRKSNSAAYLTSCKPLC